MTIKDKVINWALKSASKDQIGVAAKSFEQGLYSTTDGKGFLAALNGGGLRSAEEYAGWVFVAIDTWGKYFAKAKFRVYSIGRERTELPDHPFADLFIQPNDFQSWWEMKYRFAMDLSLCGNSYLYKVRDRFGVVRRYQQLDPTKVIPKSNIETGKPLSHYEYNAGGQKITIKPEDIIHFRYPNPKSQIIGRPIIANVADTATVNAFQMDYSKKFYEQGGFLGLTFTTEKEMSNAAFDRAKRELREEYSGSGKAYAVGLFDSGLKPVAAPHSIKEMDIANLRKTTKEEILAAWNVPPILVGLGEGINRNTAEASIFQFTSGTIDPILSYFDDVFSQAIRLEYGSNLEVVHDTLAPKDIAGRIQVWEKGLKDGWLTINEVRSEEGYNEYKYELANVGMINVGGAVVRLDTGSQIASENEKPGKDSGMENKRHHGALMQKSGISEIAFKQFESRHEALTRKFSRPIKGYIDSQRRRVTEAIKDNYIVGEAFDLDNENLILFQLLENDIWDILKQGYRYGALSYDLDGSMNPGQLQDSFNQIVSRLKLFNESTMQQVQGLSGLSESEILVKLDEIFDKASSVRLDGIIGTTVTAGFNAGLLQSMINAGCTKKIWVSHRDDRVRDRKGGESHKVPDNIVVAIDEPFYVPNRSGYDLMMYPADPTASDENVINCRCTIIGEF